MFIVYLLLCTGSHLMLRAADYRNNTVPARAVFSVIIALAVTTVCESRDWTKVPVVCLLQKDSMVTQQWLQLHGHWAQNWICVLHIKKRISIITKTDKKKIPSGLVEVSNSFDLVFGLFSALFPSDFIWKIVSNTLFSWMEWKQIDWQCVSWPRWETFVWKSSRNQRCLDWRFSIYRSWTICWHCLIWISEETQQEKSMQKTKRNAALN